MKPFEALKEGAAGIAEKFTGFDPKLLQAATRLVGDMPDGVTGLMKQFQDKGLGDVASFLTGKGPKVDITPEQIVKGFGSDQINALAASSGLDPGIVPEKLVAILPKVVEQLAPAAKFAGVK